MKPVDLRNATWADVLKHVTDDLHRVHEAWARHGPGTTREVAERSGISLLTLRPRTTDLYKLGLIALTARAGSEGIYSACTQAEAEDSAHWRERADFRRSDSDRRPEQAQRVEGPPSPPTGYPTVEAAINSLPLADRAALGARLMAKYGALLKKHEAGRADQLSLAV